YRLKEYRFNAFFIFLETIRLSKGFGWGVLATVVMSIIMITGKIGLTKKSHLEKRYFVWIEKELKAKN
ncbi:hypothetical protein, partial [Halobacillus seohaensis]